MPSVTPKQRKMMAIAEHHPDQLYARNRGALAMSHQQLHDFAATKGLSHDHTPPGFGAFAHAGTTREGPRFRSATRRGGSEQVQEPGKEDVDAFSDADTINTTMHERKGSVAVGRSASVAGNQEPKAFANSGTSKKGPTEDYCATDVDREGWGGSGTRPRIRRARGGGFANVPRTAQSGGAGASRAGHYGLSIAEKQNKSPGGYAAAGIGGRLSPANKIPTRSSPSPKPPGREDQDAFKNQRNTVAMPKRPGR